MYISYTQPLQRAWDHMVRMLFRPFDLTTWLVLGFSAWLANLAGSGSGGSVGNFDSDLRRNRFEGDAFAESLRDGWEYVLNHSWLLSLIVGGFVFFVVLIVLVTWISSRGKFIFLDNVVRRRHEITEPWKRFRRLGDSLFWFRLLLGLVQLSVGLVIGWGAILLFLTGFGAFGRPEGAVLGVLIALWVMVLLLYIVISIAIAFFLDAFVVPIMYRFELTTMEAWKYFLPLFSRHGGSFILCALFVLGLAIAVMLGVVLVGFMTCCIGFVLLAIPYVGTVILLPIAVTYRAFTVQWLGQLHPDLVLIRPPGEPLQGT